VTAYSLAVLLVNVQVLCFYLFAFINPRPAIPLLIYALIVACVFVCVSLFAAYWNFKVLLAFNMKSIECTTIH